MTPEDLCSLAKRIPFFSRKAPLPDLPRYDLVHVESIEAARCAFYETGQDFLKIEAQGDLTGWLSKHAYSDYGGVWNKQAKKFEEAITPITSSISLPKGLDADFEQDLRNYVQNLIVLYGMESFYAKHPKRPKTFSTLVQILEAGYLPCGCTLPWPSKEILVF